MEKFVLCEKNDTVGTVTLHDPEKMNAFSQPLVAELTEALETMWYDSAIRAVIIRGSGGNFSAGGDLKGMKARVDCHRQGLEPPSDVGRNMRGLNRLVLTVRRTNKPVIAQLEGAVAGGGLGLAMACDFSIAEEGCKFVFAFSNIALAPDMGATLLLSRRVGVPKATELMMTGCRFSGRQAADWGIVTEAVPAQELEPRVLSLARKLSNGPTCSYAAVKEAINRNAYGGLEAALEAEVAVQSRLARSEDHMEAVTAFLEKRAASFQGK
ncbi:1,2-epoxyphenylacetyl-CoA isomerase [bioreactor metagenome]|uniref:1,2-epoxyphenylacetyl-CoA isomerase n=1 Tax=bioreactor metagenome TaxID=1076179 RepID=A0A644XV46_9ZZZZ